MLNAILHHVGMSLIICPNNKIFYEIEENNHPNWFNKIPWYSIEICSKLYGKVFEDFIKNARTDRYNFMCYIIAHDKQQHLYDDDKISMDVDQ